MIDNPEASIALVAAQITACNDFDTGAGGKRVDFDSIQEAAQSRAANDIETVDDKKPSVLDQLKKKFSGKDKGIFSNKKDELSI